MVPLPAEETIESFTKPIVISGRGCVRQCLLDHEQDGVTSLTLERVADVEREFDFTVSLETFGVLRYLLLPLIEVGLADTGLS